MSLATNPPLPADLPALRAFAAELQAELARKDIELAANAAEIHPRQERVARLAGSSDLQCAMGAPRPGIRSGGQNAGKVGAHIRWTGKNLACY